MYELLIIFLRENWFKIFRLAVLSFLHSKQPRRVFIIQFEKKLDAFGFVGEWLRTVGQINGFVQLVVGFYKFGRHG